MVSVKKAQRLILDNVRKGLAARAATLDCVGRILAEDIISPEDFPRFRQSAMDGYALRFEDLDKAVLKVSGKIFAGGRPAAPLKAGECTYITTGSPLPRNAGAVVPVEDVKVEADLMRILAKIEKSDNIRNAG